MREYVDIASVGVGVAGIEGLAATLGFEVGYKDGNFVIAAKAGACLGLGGEGSVSCKVGLASIFNFMPCVAHQLKQADYSKLKGLMSEEIFGAYNQVLYMVQVGEKQLRDFVDSQIFNTVARIGDAYEDAIDAVRLKGERFIRELEQQMRAKWGWFAYMPPEARGAMIASIMDIANQPQFAFDRELRQLAAFSVNELLATTQSDSHLENTLDRITLVIGSEGDRAVGVARVNALLADSSFSGGIARAAAQVAKASPMIQRPFMRNDESSFLMAQLPFSHPSAVA